MPLESYGTRKKVILSHSTYFCKAFFRTKFVVINNGNKIGNVPILNLNFLLREIPSVIILSFKLLLIIMLNLTSFVNVKYLDTALYADKIIRLIKLNAKLMHAVLQLTWK